MNTPEILSHYKIKIYPQIDALASVWQQFAPAENPFLRFEFLSALEKTASVGEGTGWFPYHISLHHVINGTDDAVMPLYIKMHSYGEYVFDHSWAHAWQEAGGNYYPKLLGAIPFTPVTGQRILTRHDLSQFEATEIKNILLNSIMQLCRKNHFSSWHVNFPCDDDLIALEKAGFLIRHDIQFHWFNRNYQNFEEFLQDLTSRKRKNIRKERAELSQKKIHFRKLRGKEITQNDWENFYQFYCTTYDKKWGTPYLTRAFFTEIATHMSANILLILADYYGTDHHGKCVAGALNFIGKDRLYGRNWGCNGDFKFLHFETCYYQAIDYAITHKLACVEAGTQGAHKLERGYCPIKTYSAHYLPHPIFRNAVAKFILHNNAVQENYLTTLKAHLPFKKHNHQP